jgi:hypothetical protein
MEADTFGVGLAHQAKANSLQLTNLEVMLNDYGLDYLHNPGNNTQPIE